MFSHANSGPRCALSAKPDHPSGWPLDRYRSINALAETVVGLYKPECMMIDGPFRTADELKLATFSWVHWFKENRLHSSIGYLTPIEKQDEYYRDINSQSQPALGELIFH
ncbi:integrase core domain-containing protein [Microbacterium elymi]|uniref:integrase core domain-containing protein n=1 Tax=Microbacterium elymi TaxID=2909587 RepID=UPI00338F462E